MGDRSGGREAKGSSLKKSKNNPGSTVALKKQAKSIIMTRSSGLHPLLEGVRYVDNAVAIASRLFEHDRDRMIKRSQEENVAVISWCNDMEKLPIIADISKDHSGLVYFLSGVHPDNIDRANKKANDIWLEKVTEMCCRSECIAVLSGLNLSRDLATHFAQETLLKSACGIASRFQLPLVLHISPTSFDRLVELLTEEKFILSPQSDSSFPIDSSTNHILVHDIVTAAGGDVELVQRINSYGFYYSVSAAGLQDSMEIDISANNTNKTAECIRAIPRNRLMMCSDAPWKTPQNITDPYLRTLRNEPCNLSFILKSVASILGLPEEDLAQIIHENCTSFYGLGKSSSDVVTDGGAHVSDSSIGATTTTVAIGKQTGVTKKGTSALSKATTSYCCRKCRSHLMNQADIKTHGEVSVDKHVFKVGQEEGICQSNIFVSCEEDMTGFVTNRDSVECMECGAKLGRYYKGEAACACGTNVSGPVYRINTAKVDIKYSIDTDEQLDELATLSKAEIELSSLKLQYEAEHVGDGDTDKKAKKKGKIIKERGAGNFSSYRNKSFIPNASRISKNKAEIEDDTLVSSMLDRKSTAQDEMSEEGSDG